MTTNRARRLRNEGDGGRLGAAEAQALAAEAVAIERGVTTAKIAEAEDLALHAGAFNGIPIRSFI